MAAGGEEEREVQRFLRGDGLQERQRVEVGHAAVRLPLVLGAVEDIEEPEPRVRLAVHGHGADAQRRLAHARLRGVVRAFEEARVQVGVLGDLDGQVTRAHEVSRVADDEIEHAAALGARGLARVVHHGLDGERCVLFPRGPPEGLRGVAQSAEERCLRRGAYQLERRGRGRHPTLSHNKFLPNTMFRLLPPAERVEAVREWTSDAYRQVQNMRRQGTVNDSPNDPVRYKAQSLNYAIATAMRNRLGLAAPKKPPGFAQVKYLYRGIQMTGPFAPAKIRDSLRRHGGIVDKGYLAFSTDPTIAVSFAQRAFPHRALVLKLPIDSLPKGTPYIWFGKAANASRRMTQSYAAHEREVLLPPGLLKVSITEAMIRGLLDTRNNSIISLNATYVPDTSTKSQGVHVFGKAQSASRSLHKVSRPKALEALLLASSQVKPKVLSRKRKQTTPLRYANPNNSKVRKMHASMSNFHRNYLKMFNLKAYPIVRAILAGETNPHILKTAYKLNPFPNAHNIQLVDLVISYGVPRQLKTVAALRGVPRIYAHQFQEALRRKNWKKWVDALLLNRKSFVFSFQPFVIDGLVSSNPYVTRAQMNYFVKKRAISLDALRKLPREGRTSLIPLFNYINSLNSRRVTRSMTAKRAES